MKKWASIVSALVISTQVSAAGFSNFATPTRIDIERDNGFMIYGDFGNAGECTNSNQIYVQSSHPQYDKIYAAALAAFTSGAKVQAYIHSCTTIRWYSTSRTQNTMQPHSTLNITRN